MFPYADRDQFAVEIYLPQGTPINHTTQVTDSLYTILSKDKRVKSITSFEGMASPRFQATYAPNLGGENYAQFIVNTSSNEATIAILNEVCTTLSKLFP